MAFSTLKLAGLPKTSAKLSKLPAGPKVPSISITKIKVPKGAAPKSLNFSKYIKTSIKVPKLSTKKATLKKIVKKSVKF